MEQSKKVLRVKKRKKHSKKYYIIEGIRKTIMMLALFTFSYVSYELTNIYLEYKDADDAYADVNVMLGGEVDEEGNDGEVETDSDGNVISNVNDGDKWEWDYDSYLRFNSDTKGFIS